MPGDEESVVAQGFEEKRTSFSHIGIFSENKSLIAF